MPYSALRTRTWDAKASRMRTRTRSVSSVAEPKCRAIAITSSKWSVSAANCRYKSAIFFAPVLLESRGLFINFRSSASGEFRRRSAVYAHFTDYLIINSIIWEYSLSARSNNGGVSSRGPKRLPQVFWNLLLINASIFTSKGGEVLVTSGNQDSTLFLEIRDTGAEFLPGMQDFSK